MIRKKQRITIIIFGLFCLSLGVISLLKNFNDNIIFFYSPTDLLATNLSNNKIIRVGGLIKKNTIKKNGLNVKFELTDNLNSLLINYNGLLPSLFREEQGMIAKGRINKKIFNATELLAKHDENYMPKEIYESLKNNSKVK